MVKVALSREVRTDCAKLMDVQTEENASNPTDRYSSQVEPNVFFQQISGPLRSKRRRLLIFSREVAIQSSFHPLVNF